MAMTLSNKGHVAVLHANSRAIKMLLHSEKSLIEGPCEEGIQQILVY